MASLLQRSCAIVGWVILTAAGARAEGDWVNWRGPAQNGTSSESGLPDKWVIDGEQHLWTYDLPGRGTPVIANGRVYVLGYAGEGADLQQLLVCLDARTGKKVWQHGFNDYLSDIVYDRYSIGAPTVDPETGKVYVLTANGDFAAFTRDGKWLWEHSLMEAYGRITFPNGRTGAPVIDGDLVIVRGITSNWGLEGPAADRFYAFDKKSGQLVWSSTPGSIPPKDSSFSTPVLADHEGKRVFYCGTGDGNVVCVNARTGEPIWRYAISAGGVNASVVLWKNLLIAGHADENLDSSEMGRMVAIKVDVEPPAAGQPRPPGPLVRDRSAEAWRLNESILTSSPVLVDDRIYQVNKVGELLAIDPQTGQVIWKHKLGGDQLHASPVYADGKLYIPMRENGFYIVKPGKDGAEVLSHTKLEGEALGAPAIADGKVYVHTTERLYCFGRGAKSGEVAGADESVPPHPNPLPRRGEGAGQQTGAVTRLQIVPSEIALRPGSKQSFVIRGLDASGMVVKEFSGGDWKKFVPPTAKVRAEMDADFNDAGEIAAKPNAKLSAGSWEVTVKDGERELKGYMRGRVLPSLPYKEDFESFTPIDQTEGPPGIKFAWPPLPWIGARFKWDIRDLDGNKVLVKTLDRLLFQRAFTFIGDPNAKNYTVSADVMSEGTRRNMSNVGVINQRYVINLVGNWQQLEVMSNQDRVKVAVPFKWKPKEWYRITSRVDVAADGSGVVRAKAWKRGDPEPEAWTIEVPHQHAHTHGSPGLYGFALQGQHPVYVDNVEVRQNGEQETAE